MLKVNQVDTTNNYELQVTLSNGKKGLFDVKPYLDKGIFTELKDKGYFRSVHLVFGGVGWSHEQDFSADTIEYELKVKH